MKAGHYFKTFFRACHGAVVFRVTGHNAPGIMPPGQNTLEFDIMLPVTLPLSINHNMDIIPRVIVTLLIEK